MAKLTRKQMKSNVASAFKGWAAARGLTVVAQLAVTEGTAACWQGSTDFFTVRYQLPGKPHCDYIAGPYAYVMQSLAASVG